MSLPKLVATDLDGTLLRDDRTVSEHTVQVLAEVSAVGTVVVLVTGRPIRWLSQVYAQLPAPYLAICANGAAVYDPVRDQLLRTDPLEPHLLRQVCARLRAEVPGVAFAVELDGGRHMRHEPEYPIVIDVGNPLVVPVATLAELYAQPATKLLVRAGQRDPDEFMALVAGHVAGLAEATHSSRSGLVEVSAAGVTKAAALAWLCERLGITAADVLAFGDMPNDIPMLTWAGRAVSVANAHPAVVEVADEVTASNEDDGVAVYLSKL